MKLSHFYSRVIKFGIERDPRKNNRHLTYPDTAILHGNPDTDLKKIMVGIDIDVGDLLLADRVRSRKGLDLVISHHPQGKALAALFEVMQVQVDILQAVGISKKVAQELLDERKQEVERRLLAQNHMHSVDAARLLDLPFICVHTPADNHVFSYIQKLMDNKKPKKVEDILDILNEIPEYKEAAGAFAGPRVILGSPKRPAGKALVEMTGGTEGSKEVFEKLYKTGVRTLICMHLSEEHFKKAKDANLNLVIAGHISSDNLGLNLLLDRLEKEEEFEIFNCSGFRRVRRN